MSAQSSNPVNNFSFTMRLSITAIPLTLFLLLSGTRLLAAPDFDRVMALEEPPGGVVFEIVESEADALNWAIPKTAAMIGQLRRRFPGLPVAVVSHGSEMFALTLENSGTFKPVHDTVRSLSREQEVDVHVCGTHAGWYNTDESDFPAYVDLAPVGPTQIGQYQELGYHLIRIEKR